MTRKKPKPKHRGKKRSASMVTHYVPKGYRRRARPPHPIDLQLGWYVLRAKPRREDAIATDLKAQGVAVYVPALAKGKIFQTRCTLHREIIFPGYVFIGTEAQETLGLVAEHEHAAGFLGPPERPQRLPDPTLLQRLEAELSRGEDEPAPEITREVYGWIEGLAKVREDLAA